MLKDKRILDLNNRLELHSENPIEGIICFPEIHVTKEQVFAIDEFYVSVGGGKKLLKYYRDKLDGNFLLSSSVFTTREDQPDFQYIFDLGIKALKNGLTL